MLGKSLVAPPAPCQDICDDGTDAVVYGQKMQPILAVMSGVVTAVEEDDPVGGLGERHDHRRARPHVSLLRVQRRHAGHRPTVPRSAPYRLTVLAKVGTQVRAGQVIGFMGDTDPMPSNENFGIGDEAVWPHLRLSIYDADGTKLNADSLVAIAQRRQACHVVHRAVVAAARSAASRTSTSTTSSTEPILSGNWTVHPDGTLTATGKSAQIVPAGRLHVVAVGDVRVRRQGRHPDARSGASRSRSLPSSGSRRLATTTLPTATPRSG